MMKKIMIIAFFLIGLSNIYATAIIQGSPFRFDSTGLPNVGETIYATRMLEEKLKAQQLQNQLIAMQLASYLESNPKLAKSLKDKNELQAIIKRNNIFYSKKNYINELNNCALHGNKYCAIKFKEELTKCNKIKQC